MRMSFTRLFSWRQTEMFISATRERSQRVRRRVVRLLWGTGTSWACACTGCRGPTGLRGRTSSVLPERWMANCTSTSVRPAVETNACTREFRKFRKCGRLVAACWRETPRVSSNAIHCKVLLNYRLNFPKKLEIIIKGNNIKWFTRSDPPSISKMNFHFLIQKACREFAFRGHPSPEDGVKKKKSVHTMKCETLRAY